MPNTSRWGLARLGPHRLLVFVLLVAAGSAAQAQSPAQAAQETIQRERARQRLATLTARMPANAVAVAAERAGLLADLMHADPGAVLQYAVTAAVRASLPSGLQALVEYEMDVEGDVEVYYEDYDDTARIRRFLNAAGGRLELHFASDPFDMQTGDRVRVRGVRLNNDVAADGGDASVVQVTSVAANTFGEQRVLMILVNFPDNLAQPYSVASAHNLLFDQVNEFYRENSQGQTWLAGDVTGWHTIPVSTTSCDSSAISSHARQAAQKAGINLSAYRRFIYAFPKNACSWWGLGQLGGSTTNAWVNGKLAVRVVAHELGHNFGVSHARALDCGTASLGTSCKTVEYGDIADVMGVSGVVAHLNAYFKERLGWLNYRSSLPILTVHGSGVYAIEAYAAPGGGPKALKILKDTDPKTGRRTWYYVEHRYGHGFDGKLLANANLAGGVIIRTGSESGAGFILDMTPETSSWSDPALPVGRSFSDPDAGVTITTLATGPGGATVLIDRRAAECRTAAPTVTLSPAATQTGMAGGNVTWTIAVRNNNAIECSPSIIDVSASVPGGWYQNLSPARLSPAPGASATASLTVTSAVSAPGGTFPIDITAVDSVSGQSTAATAVYSVAGSLGVTLDSSAAAYNRNQSIVLTARAAAGSQPLAGATVGFVITAPNGARMTAAATTAADGTATYQFRLKPKEPAGTYHAAATVSAGTLSASAHTLFTVQ